jgi:hypothetical protein
MDGSRRRRGAPVDHLDLRLAPPGIVIGLLLVTGSLEFLGPVEATGWKPAGAIVPIAYVGWSVWLVTAGFLPSSAEAAGPHVRGERENQPICRQMPIGARCNCQLGYGADSSRT